MRGGVLACALIAQLCWQSPVESRGLRVVALTDERNAMAGQRITRYYDPILNDLGQTAFGVGIVNEGFTYPVGGLATERSDGIRVVATYREPVPNAEAAVFGLFGIHNLGSSTGVVFSSRLSHPPNLSETSPVLWQTSPDGLHAIVRTGAPALDFASGGLISDLPLFRHPAATNDRGTVAFRAGIKVEKHVGFDTLGSIQIQTPDGGLHSIARSRKSIQVEGVDVTLGDSIGPPVVNPKGDLAFWSSMHGGPISVLWSFSEGQLTPLTPLNIQRDPNGDRPRIFNSYSPTKVPDEQLRPSINGMGQVAFNSIQVGIEPDETVSGIWSNGAGEGLQAVAREGDPVPGVGPEFQFGDFLDYPGEYYQDMPPPVLNDLGEVAFRARFTNPESRSEGGVGIWHGTDSSDLELIALVGDQAPGAAPGVDFSWVGQPASNGLGQVAFAAGLSSVSRQVPLGIWIKSPGEDLRSVIQEGDVINVGRTPGEEDLRTVGLVSFVGGSGGSDGMPRGLNNRGQLVFSASLSNAEGYSYGVFVVDTRLVPEPHAMSLFASVLIYAARRRFSPA